MITTRAPGKLFVAGEYAVVEPGEPAVLIAVDRFLTVELTPGSGAGHIHSPEYGALPLVWTRDRDAGGIVLEHRPSDYVMSALEVLERLRDERGLEPRFYDIRISSELDDAHGRKFGLGSSAAVTVAVVAALDAFYELGLTRDERFRIALLATIRIAPTASGGDVAASTFGGWIRYAAPDRAALRADLEAGTVTEALASGGWDPSSIERLPAPASMRLLVGWTGSPASTERLVDGVRHGGGGTAATSYGDFVGASRERVDALVDALRRDDQAAALGVVCRARRLLQRLGEISGITIETDELRALCDIAERHGAAGKPSGAGGGDCGVVLAPADADLADLLVEWEAHGIRRLDVHVQPPEGDDDDA
ncbi:phosphomevalonate kinase [Microbacterium sp. gxy059]|uniref:phosphomevalonate kinase n=1 Tax=uncultured bacterium WT8 TaxID=1393214 RepID=U3Q2L9_9BACT|nr:Wt8.26c [uncultured bacterium WT8]